MCIIRMLCLQQLYPYIRYLNRDQAIPYIPARPRQLETQYINGQLAHIKQVYLAQVALAVLVAMPELDSDMIKLHPGMRLLCRGERATIGGSVLKSNTATMAGTNLLDMRSSLCLSAGAGRIRRDSGARRDAARRPRPAGDQAHRGRATRITARQRRMIAIARPLLSRLAGLPRARSQPAARQPCTAPPWRRPTARIVFYAREAGGKLWRASPQY